jgi:restriction system protein
MSSINRIVKVNRRYLVGWLLLVSLTVGFVAWLLYRWLAQPAWTERLPSVLGEMLVLAQAASGFTLAFLWLGLWWRRLRQPAPRVQSQIDLDGLYALSPKAFEQYVADLFRRKGFRVKLRGRSGDHGVDLELLAPGGRRAVVQCKRYQNTVGEDIIRELFGTLIHERAAHAFLVTTAEISAAARVWAQGKPMTLIDGPTLVDIVRALDTPAVVPDPRPHPAVYEFSI